MRSKKLNALVNYDAWLQWEAFMIKMRRRTPPCYNRWSADWRFNWRRRIWVNFIHKFLCMDLPQHEPGRLMDEKDLF